MAAVQATAPLLSRLVVMTEQGGQADAALRDLVSWASWRLLAWMVGAVVLRVLFGWLASTLLLWWDTGTIGAAQLRKAQLQVELAEMQANRDEWAKAGVPIKLIGHPRRPMHEARNIGLLQPDCRNRVEHGAMRTKGATMRAGGREGRAVRDHQRLSGAAGILTSMQTFRQS